MKSSYLLKQNIDALLRARGQTRHDLAMWCRRSDAWLSKIFKEPTTRERAERGLPLKYLDRIADFFGIAAYQLFQPGIAPLTERRKAERRSGSDRRIGASIRATAEATAIPPDDLAILREINALTVEERRRVQAWVRVTRLGRTSEPAPGGPLGPGPRVLPRATPARRSLPPPVEGK